MYVSIGEREREKRESEGERGVRIWQIGNFSCSVAVFHKSGWLKVERTIWRGPFKVFVPYQKIKRKKEEEEEDMSTLVLSRHVIDVVLCQDIVAF